MISTVQRLVARGHALIFPFTGKIHLLQSGCHASSSSQQSPRSCLTFERLLPETIADFRSLLDCLDL